MFDFTFDEAVVLKHLHFDKSEPDLQKAIIGRIYEALDKRVTVRLQAEMSQEDGEAFLKAHEQGGEQAKAWLNQRFPDAHKVYQEELQSLVDTLAENADATVAAVHEQREQ